MYDDLLVRMDEARAWIGVNGDQKSADIFVEAHDAILSLREETRFRAGVIAMYGTLATLQVVIISSLDGGDGPMLLGDIAVGSVLAMISGSYAWRWWSTRPRLETGQ